MTDHPEQGLPPSPALADVFRAYPQGVPELLAYHDLLLRGASPLTVAERELIAAYVSGLNACGFCLGAHRIIAECYGVPEATLETLLNDPEMATVEARLRALLRFVQRLTQAPNSIRDEHRKAVLDAGWSERALHDAVAVCALFNFMNRLVEGMGVQTSPALQAAQRERHAQAAQEDDAAPYTAFGRRIGVVP